MHLLKVGDKLAFGETIVQVTGFQMSEDGGHIIQAQMDKAGDLVGPYFIGKEEHWDLQTTPSRLFKSNFIGHDRGEVTIEDILEIVKKEKFTNI